MKKRKVYIVHGGIGYASMFKSAGWEVTEDINDADLLQFTGGEDVSPHLYGEEKHRMTFPNVQRDKREMIIFRHKVGKVSMAGICRGGQFLNVMCGGTLWQHVNNHATKEGHIARDVDTDIEFKVTSTHHQMMEPGDEGDVIVVANVSTMKESMKGGSNVTTLNTSRRDVEAVHYPRHHVFCFQPHPEYKNHEALKIRYLNYLDDLLFTKRI